MSQVSLFGPEQAPTAKQEHDQPVRMRVLITVKAAPNPSAAYVGNQAKRQQVFSVLGVYYPPR